MMAKKYLDFDLSLEGKPGNYRVRVFKSPSHPNGLPGQDFTIPFEPLELENILLRMGVSRTPTRGGEKDNTELARDLGKRLFDQLFPGPIADSLTSSLEKAREESCGLRIRLRIEAPELGDLPWEYLYDPEDARFLSQSNQTPIVRYLYTRSTPRPLKVTPPLKVLVMISSPRDCTALQVDQEWGNLQKATQDLVKQGLLELVRLPRASLQELAIALRRDDFHVFHFIGHGNFNPNENTGFLLLEDEYGMSVQVSGADLCTQIYDEDTFKLAILNACEGARTSTQDPFAGVAQSLVRGGFSAVIAMQFPISDEAAVIFAREFYQSIAMGYPVDAALTEARKMIASYKRGTIEWGTPVLFMRTEDGTIFDIDTEQARPLTPSQPEQSGQRAVPQDRPEPQNRTVSEPTPPPNTGFAPTITGTGNGNLPPQPVPPMPVQHTINDFVPVGAWNWQVAVMGTVTVQGIWNSYPNGSFTFAAQTVQGPLQANGMWSYAPYNHLLTLQGVNHLGMPFAFQITFYNVQGEVVYGVGNDGAEYYLSPAR